MLPPKIINTNPDHGWQKVTYAKLQRRQKPAADSASKINGTAAAHDKGNVFRSLEQQSEERRQRIIESQRTANAAIVEASVRLRHRSDDDDEDSDDSGVSKANANVEEKKVKQKKPKKPKVTVAEAAAKIDAADLTTFLVEISQTLDDMNKRLLFVIFSIR